MPPRPRKRQLASGTQPLEPRSNPVSSRKTVSHGPSHQPARSHPDVRPLHHRHARILQRTRLSLPPPVLDEPEDRERRLAAAVETFEALRPGDAYEARLAVRIVVCGAHAIDSLRLAGAQPTTSRK